MKWWWGKFVKDYLTFSKKERSGIVIILLLCVMVYCISRFIPIHHLPLEKGAFQQELTRLKISIDTSHRAYTYQHDEITADDYRPKQYDKRVASAGELFAFDPNTLNEAGWKKLGLRDKTIHTIHNFIAKGYRFRRAEDIRKIYGVGSRDADRLIPYVRIAEKEAYPKNTFEKNNYTLNANKRDAEINRNKIIDINTADTAEFISLPGIGSKLATRIVNFREKLGGFHSINQLGETYGIPDSTFQLIKARLQCTHASIKKININTAEANELKNHPYIKWNIANSIVNYRNQHGAYTSVEDLRKIEIITDEVFNKIAPYLVL